LRLPIDFLAAFGSDPAPLAGYTAKFSNGWLTGSYKVGGRRRHLVEGLRKILRRFESYDHAVTG
jgi:hypothetical protein